MCDISCSKIKAIYKTPRCNLLLGLTCTSQDMESHHGLPQVSHSSLNGVGGLRCRGGSSFHLQRK